MVQWDPQTHHFYSLYFTTCSTDFPTQCAGFLPQRELTIQLKPNDLLIMAYTIQCLCACVFCVFVCKSSGDRRSESGYLPSRWLCCLSLSSCWHSFSHVCRRLLIITLWECFSGHFTSHQTNMFLTCGFHPLQLQIFWASSPKGLRVC